ncbi:MAG: aryl-sulfate sulfotransferase [Ginsengibacter sp.]
MKPLKLTLSFVALFYIFSVNTGCEKNYITPVDVVDSIPHDSVPYIDSTLYTVTGSGKDSGDILIAMNIKNSTDGILLVLNKDGYIKKKKDVGARADDFQRWTFNGKTYYSYLLAEGNYAIAGQGTEEGYDVICDSDLNELWQAKYIDPSGSDTADDRLDVHDFILLGENHYMAISAHLEHPTNIPDSLNPSPNVTVVSCRIEEVDNGQVVFHWNGTDYPELYGESVENNNFSDSVNTMDYMHMNSICIDPNDNNIICSSRNLDEIIKINRTTGDIMWRLGGKHSDFALTSDEKFLRQHFARFTDDDGKTLMFVDNGDQTLRPYSRILEFQLDENAKSITSFNAFKVPNEFIRYAGSVKKENGYYFIGGGSANFAMEVNYTTSDVNLMINQNYSSYRAMKY